ncbi:MAG: tetratricopeptide repeat protein [Planctomycetes bacterium]|nr:tetratricopeptide repeat protein [Planctomycetota bacterium]
MPESLLVNWYNELPHFQTGDDPDLWTSQMHKALRHFRRKVRVRYFEGTLQRLLDHPSVRTRRAAVLALGLTGTVQSNAPLAKLLHDEDELVSKTASDSLWEIWFRGDNDEASLELQRIMHLPDREQVMNGLEQLIKDKPEFAEAYNQRAILHYQHGQFAKSVADCEKVMELNPFHFGAQAGMGQCYIKLRKYSSALRAFQLALDINPTLTDLTETIRNLQGIVEES